jgi:hypothetical protein
LQGGKNKNLEAVQDKRDLQTEITFSMLSVRVAEIRGAWLENRNHLVTILFISVSGPNVHGQYFQPFLKLEL